jgi:glycosyltransferase involved in cell wall biosynthesis
MVEGLVSIITPCYNCSAFIAQTIESVLAQTYQNWEMIIVDDCSTDDSREKICSYIKSANRIKLFKTIACSGSPVEPRNIGIQKAQGRYIAFLDSDDIWLPTKLENQIPFFKNIDIAIVFSYYEKIGHAGNRNNRIILSPGTVTYKKLLKGNCIGCLTSVFDTVKTGKLFFQKIGHEDYAFWLTILRRGYIAQNTNTIEALHRVRDSSLSSNKFIASKWTWNIYHDFLRLSWIESLYYFSFYFIKAIIKHIQ